MYRFPVPTLFVNLSTDQSQKAWDDLQQAVGDGMLCATIDTPEKRGAMPNVMEILPFQTHAPASYPLDRLTFAWRLFFDTLLNRRWDLVDNPYARLNVVKGAILIHQDPLGWMIDGHAEDIRAGSPLDNPTCVIVVPLPTSHHALLAAAANPIPLARADLLDEKLNLAAIAEGHADLTPLAWATAPASPGQYDVLDV